MTLRPMNRNVNRTPVLITATLSGFLTSFLASAVSIALPSIGREYAMNAVLMGWVATVFLLTAAMFLVPMGRLADIVGRKRLYTWGIVLDSLSSLFLALTHSADLVIPLRALQGAGGAMIFCTGVAILISVFPMEERGKVLGVYTTAVYSGQSLGPFLGGFLTQHFGWRSIFWAAFAIGFLIWTLIVSKLKGEWVESKGESFDYPGTLIYMPSLIALMYGFSILPAPLGLWLILGGLSGIVIFIKWEAGQEYPLLDVNLLRHNRIFAFSNLAALINYCATAGIVFLMSLYLQYIKGLTPEQAGLLIVAQPVIQALFSSPAGKLSDRVEPRILISLGMTLTCAGLVNFVFLSEKTSELSIVMNMMLIGFSFALFSSPNANAIMSSVEKKYLSVASGTLATMRMTGQMLSMGITMLVFALFIGRVQITPAYYSFFLKSLKAIFAVFAILCCGGIFISAVRGKMR